MHVLVVVSLCWGAVPADDIDIVLRQGRGTAEGRLAWQRLSQAGPETLPLLLDAMGTKDTATDNWLRTAFDRIVDRELAAGAQRLDVDRLLRFIKDATKSGRGRRLALEVVERLRPGTSAMLYPAWLDDPEFRYEAVALLLDRARAQHKTKDAAAEESYRLALAKSRDVRQAREAAAGLQAFGVEISVAQHLGFLTDWHIIGPFDAEGRTGFRRTYPPEKRVALDDVLDGLGKKLRWQRVHVKEASPASGAKHQVLVNMRELGDADDAVGFAYTEFELTEPRVAEFRGAADDNFTVWVNGKKVFGFEEYRNGVRFDRHRFKASLVAGKNSVLVKVCQTNPEPNWEFFLRVVDETGKGIAMRSLVSK